MRSIFKVCLLIPPIILLGACGGSDSGNPVPTNSAPTATNVTITGDNIGNIVVGTTLTGTYTYNDVDGDAEGSSTIRWLRDNVAITGATSSTYVVVANDSVTNLSFEVSPMAATGTISGAAAVSSPVFITNSAPVVSGVAILDANGGDVFVGDTLTAQYTYSDVDGDAENFVTYRWFKNSSLDSSVTSAVYPVANFSAGDTLMVQISVTAVAGILTSDAVNSATLTVMNSAPTASNVTISGDTAGNALVGDVLTGNYSYTDADGDSEGTSTYRWLRNGGAISGAIMSNYTLVGADDGQLINFEVTPVDVVGTTASAPFTSSNTVTVVSNLAPTASDVTILDNNSGNIVVGVILTGSYTFADTEGDLEGVSTFRWLRNGTAIALATDLSYTLVNDDSGQSISFEVTPIAQSGITLGSAVESTGISVNNEGPTATLVSITDDNAGSAVFGDNLTGIYTYNDTEGDLEATSAFQWLRNGIAIRGATANTYTLDTTDAGQSISFAVTPMAATGTSKGTSAVSTGISVSKSVDIVILADTSGGMLDEVAALQTNLNNFAANLEASGLSVRIILVADGAAICPPAPLTTGTCPTVDNAPKYFHIEYTVGSGAIYTALQDNASGIEALLNPGSLLHIIGITDDESTVTSSVYMTNISGTSTRLSQARFHAIVATSEPTVAPCMGNAVAKGNEYMSYATTTGGVVRDLCAQTMSVDLTEIATSIVNADWYNIQVVDQRLSPMADVKVFVNDGLVPAQLTTADGRFALSLSDTDSIHLKKSGYEMSSFYSGSWKKFAGKQVNLPSKRTTLTGTVQGNIINPITDPNGIRISIATGSISSISDFTPNSITSYNSSAPVGIIDVLGTPTQIDVAAADALFAFNKNNTVLENSTSNADLTLNYGGKMFSVSVSGGYATGDIYTGYQYYQKPGLTKFLTTQQSTPIFADSIVNQTVTIPNNFGLDTVYANLLVRAAEGEKLRTLKSLFQSTDELNNAASTQSFNLLDFGVLAIAPTIGGVNVGISPTFSWSVSDTTVSDIKLQLIEIGVAGNIWKAFLGPLDTTIPYPVKGPVLKANTMYTLRIIARKKQFDVTGNQISVYTSGVTNIDFNTGI